MEVEGSALHSGRERLWVQMGMMGEGEYFLDGSLMLSCHRRQKEVCKEGSGWGLKRWRDDLMKSAGQPHREKVVRIRMKRLHAEFP